MEENYKKILQNLEPYSEEKFTISTYEKVLNGEIKSFSPYFFEIKYRKKRIIILVKHLVENLLKITPEEALKKLEVKDLKKYKLSCLLKYINKPDELKKEEISHLLYYVYPELPRMSVEESIIKTYKEVLDGTRRNFPKNYFADPFKGETRARICIKYLCENILKFRSEEIPKKLTIEVLKEYKLKILLNILYCSMFDLITNVYENKYTSKDF